MEFIDTHSHLYLEQFEEDHKLVVERAKNNNVNTIILPNIDTNTIKPLLGFCEKYTQICVPLMGLHPTHVKENYREELDRILAEFSNANYKGVGEIGIDLYWDTTYIEEQKISFREQVLYAQKMTLPFVIHSRESFSEVIEVLQSINSSEYKGVFHAFPGNYEQACQVIEMGFKIGIGGVLTFKKSHLPELVAKLDIEHIVLETDSPYLAPVPHRGKRNESSYIPLIAQNISEIKEITLEKIAEQTTYNAQQIFSL